MSFSKRIKQLRLKKGLSQIEAAKLIGIGNRTLSDYERNITSPDPDTIKKLALFYCVSTDYILGLTNNLKINSKEIDKRKQMTIEEKEKYLLMASYTAREIMELTGLKRASASAIMNECKIKYGVAIKYRPNSITAESFWLREGTTLEKQLKFLGIAKGYYNNV